MGNISDALQINASLSSINSQKFIIIFLNVSIYCIYNKNFNVFL